MRALALTLTIVGLWAGVAGATTESKDLLIKFADAAAIMQFTTMAESGGARVESLGDDQWVRVQLTDEQFESLSLERIRSNPNVLAVQPNYKLRLFNDFKVKDPALRAKLMKHALAQGMTMKELTSSEVRIQMKDNPDIPTSGSGGSGADPLFNKQWGMNDIGAKNGWKSNRGGQIIVAVIDTGVDYTHPDLVDNLWRNNSEIPNNGVDDDGNGYADDIVGWDFVSNDNKPFDLAVTNPIDLMMKGGNPGHGTHCAGNVAGRGDNGKGIAGAAPEAKIMVLRFLSEKGEGTTAAAIQSINYAVKNGAKVLSNSWGSIGEDPNDAAGNQALRDAITNAERAGALFIAAAGNGKNGVGYDNDTDATPAYPASYDHDVIVSVAAIAENNKLGGFSNWGKKTVDLAAPGVVVFSTTVEGKYSDTVIDYFGIKATWDGTSMATPHVAGAAALYWTKHPNATWREVKNAIMTSTTPVPEYSNKLVTGGKLNIDRLMAR